MPAHAHTSPNISLCSRFAQESVKIQPPKSIDAEELQETSIAVTIDAQGTIYFQGRLVPDADAVEWGVRSLVEGKKSERARTVMFRCDKGVSKAVFEPVIEAISKGGGLVAAVGEKTKE